MFFKERVIINDHRALHEVLTVKIDDEQHFNSRRPKGIRTEAYSEPCEIYKIKLFAEIVNDLCRATFIVNLLPMHCVFQNITRFNNCLQKQEVATLQKNML